MTNQNPYEDEIDRMRSRRARNRRTPQAVPRRETAPDAFETYEDAEHIHTSVRKRKKKRRKKHVLGKLIFLVIFLCAGLFLYRSLRADGYWTIAVFGVDSRDGNLGKGALSDVEMLCSINRKTGEIRLTSVFRDSYLRIDEKGRFDKINEAYFLGGHKQAVEALEANFDLTVDDYATFNWKAVVDAINVLGGVDLEITDKEFAYINSFITETVESTNVGSVHLEHSGMNHLDGVQAVAYARLRLMDTDFNRTERQRRVLGLAMEKAKQADGATLKTLVTTVFPQISTSIGLDDLLGMAKNARKYYIGQTSGFPFSHVEMKIGKKSCVIPATLESNVIQLHGFLYDDSQYTPSATVREISSQIARESGVSDPGKDTESGKNTGAEGTGGGQSQTPAKKEPAQTQPEAAAPETAASEQGDQKSEAPETGGETESRDLDPETDAENPDEEDADKESEGASGEAGEGSKNNAGEGAGIIRPLEQPSGTAGSDRPTASAPGETSHSSKPQASEPQTSTGALEAPGQGSGNGSQNQDGPGGSGGPAASGGTGAGSGTGSGSSGGTGGSSAPGTSSGKEDSKGSGVVSAPGA